MGKTKLRVVKIWKDNYPWDVRVEKISRVIVNSGHEVYLLCRNTKKLKTDEIVDGIHIKRLLPIKIDLLNKIYSIPFFLNPIWLLKILRVARSTGANVLLTRDLPLALSGILIGKILSIVTVYDMAENYPALWRGLDRRKLGNFIFKNPVIAKLMEKVAIKYSDYIIVVVEESMNRLLRSGVKPEKIAIVRNTPQMQLQAEMPPPHEISIPKDKFILLYTGMVDSRVRGLEVVIEALKTLSNLIPNIHLAIVGTGRHSNHIMSAAAQMHVRSHVLFYGWVDHHFIPSYILKSHVCIIPHVKNSHTDTTVPNKLFDYMACKKPVIVSDANPLKRIVSEEKCGLVFESCNKDSFVEAVMKLWNNPQLRDEMGANGYNAVRQKYNWSVDAHVLLETLQKAGEKVTC